MASELHGVAIAEGPEPLELFAPPIAPALRPYVRSWSGYSERTLHPLRRRELPAPQFVMILEFGPPLRVLDSGREVGGNRYQGGFVAGLDDTFTITEHDGYQAGIQVNLTPLGARALLQRPLHELTHRVVSLPDLLPGQRLLADRLASARGWRERFEIVERLLRERLARAAHPNAAAAWASARIEQAAGRLDIGALAAELGHSRKHVAALFHEHVGLSPKAYAGLVRFDRLSQRLRAPGAGTWAELAFELGYADQAHLARQVRRFTGCTPTLLRRELGAAGVIEGL